MLVWMIWGNTPYISDPTLRKYNVFLEDIIMDSDILLDGDGKSNDVLRKPFTKSYLVREIENGKRIIRICTLDGNNIVNDIKIDIDSESKSGVIYRLYNNIFRYSYNYENFRRGYSISYIKGF